MNLLVTGGSGHVGRCLVPHLAESHNVIVLDLKPPGFPVEQFVRCDLSEMTADSVPPGEIDAIVHLAANPDEAQPLNDSMVRGNLIGVDAMFRFAVARGVGKVLLASSSQAFLAWPMDQTVAADAAYRPASVYGATKVFAEALGRHYTDAHGLSVIAIRIGAMLPEDWERGLADSDEFARLWLSPDDCRQLFDRALAADLEGFHAVFATSRVDPEYLSLDTARDLLGYEPRDRLRDYYAAHD